MILDRALAITGLVATLVAATAAGGFAWHASRVETKLEFCIATKATIEAKVDEQNREIRSFASAASAATQNTAQALQTAQALSQAKAGQIAALQAQIKGGKDISCDDAVRQIQERLAKP